MLFNEEVFVKAVTQRPETARQLSKVFQAEWLEQAELRPILQEVYNFLNTKHVPPSIATLREIFKNLDYVRYENRFKEVFDKLEKLEPDISEILYHIDKAREVAITRSLQAIVDSELFSNLRSTFDGTGQVEEIKKWMRLFQESGGAVEMDMKEAVDSLIQERGITSYDNLILKTGIDFIDEWCGGGLRPKQLAILLAPTGHGKSIVLGTIAHNIARQLEKKVLYISNELSMEEVTERFLSKITGVPISDIMKDPVTAYKGLERHWNLGLHKHLKLVEVLQEFDTDYVEALLMKYVNLYGWKPDVIVLDYMERMKPTVSVKRDQSWGWLGYIAKDLVRLAKKGNYLIWTAGQINRAGYNAPEQSLAHAQGSVQHLQEATLVLAMRKEHYPTIQLPPDTDILSFKPLKARTSKLGFEPLFVESRLGTMNITKKVRSLEECQNELLKK